MCGGRERKFISLQEIPDPSLSVCNVADDSLPTLPLSLDLRAAFDTIKQSTLSKYLPIPIALVSWVELTITSIHIYLAAV